ncbi:MAG: cupin domain-containing protein [Bacillota bacterium]|nr:cupin domain-containing protein [Bacillota bacterium]MDW7684863.1 cupin domain-containing protein [Bacillota bacterium]
MEVIRMSDVEAFRNHRGVLAKKLFSHNNASVINLILQPGEEIAEHSVPVDVFFYIVVGKGTIRIGEDEAVVGEKDIIVCPANTVMALRADQNVRFEFLNVKTPSLNSAEKGRP